MTAATPGTPARRSTIEIFATVLLAIAAVATAWSGYQATRWNGEQVKAGGRTNALRIQAARAQGLSQAETQVDVATFVEWINASATANDTLRQFYETHFRPDFKVAFEAWIAMGGFQNIAAPPTPFKMPQYQATTTEEFADLDAAATVSANDVQILIQRSANYVLAVVLFAVVLFFAGISTKLQSPHLRIVLLSAGWVVLIGTVVWLATFPVSLSV